MTTTCNRFILQKKPHFFILNDNKDKKQISFTKNHQNIVLPVQNLGGGAFGFSYLDIYSKVFGISFQAKCVYANSSNKNIVPEILPKQIPIDTETSDCASSHWDFALKRSLGCQVELYFQPVRKVNIGGVLEICSLLTC